MHNPFDIEVCNFLDQNVAKCLFQVHRRCFEVSWTEQDYINFIFNDLISVTYAKNKNDGEIIGYVIIRQVLDEAEIIQLAVDKQFRGLGVGYALCEKILFEIQEHGIIKVYLEVNQDNISALKLYKKIGFELVSERKGYYTRQEKYNCKDAFILMLNLS